MEYFHSPVSCVNVDQKNGQECVRTTHPHVNGDNSCTKEHRDRMAPAQKLVPFGLRDLNSEKWAMHCIQKFHHDSESVLESVHVLYNVHRN